MYIYCNQNPLGKRTGDCVVRAIAIATNRSWREAYTEICKQGQIDCDMPSANRVWGKFLESVRKHMKRWQETARRMIPGANP